MTALANVLVVAEHDHGSLKGATLNTVTAAAACGGQSASGLPISQW